MLVLYSDGVTEANDVNQNAYDEERFIEVLKKNRAAPAAGIAEAVPKSLAELAAGRPHHPGCRQDCLSGRLTGRQPQILRPRCITSDNRKNTRKT
jgi:hypothetical protein